MVTLYDSIHQFEPLLPSDAAQSPLLSQAHDLARSALLLAGSAVPGELRGVIELPDDCDGTLQQHVLHWMDDGSFGVLEHKWDLVSVETASCIRCDCHDIDMDYDMAWDFVSVDRVRGLGVCNRCTGGEAA